MEGLGLGVECLGFLGVGLRVQASTGVYRLVVGVQRGEVCRCRYTQTERGSRVQGLGLYPYL